MNLRSQLARWAGTIGLCTMLAGLPLTAVSGIETAPGNDPDGQPESSETDGRPSPAQRRERMRELRHQYEAGELETRPETAWQQRPRGAWWHDDSLIEALELTETQRERLDEQHEMLDVARRDERQVLGGHRQEVRAAIGTADRDKLADLLEQYREISDQVQAAEAEWLLKLVEVLGDEQLATLANEHPRLLMGARGRQR